MNDENEDYTNKNFGLLFKKAEWRAAQLDKDIKTIIQEYGDDVDKIKSEIVSLTNGKEFYDDTEILDMISILNSLDGKLWGEDFIQYIKNYPYVVDVQIVDNQDSASKKFSRISTVYGDIEFIPVSDLLRQSEQFSPYNEQDALNRYCDKVEDITSRNGNCHELSIEALKLFCERFNTKSNIVTGDVCYYSDKNKYMHSWLEFDVAGKECVLDSTKNIIIDKPSYYRLLHINEIYSVISSDDIIEDDIKYGKLLNELDYKTYLTSRDEIIRDLKRNEQLFDRKDENPSEER